MKPPGSNWCCCTHGAGLRRARWDGHARDVPDCRADGSAYRGAERAAHDRAHHPSHGSADGRTNTEPVLIEVDESPIGIA